METTLYNTIIDVLSNFTIRLMGEGEFYKVIVEVQDRRREKKFKNTSFQECSNTLEGVLLNNIKSEYLALSGKMLDTSYNPEIIKAIKKEKCFYPEAKEAYKSLKPLELVLLRYKSSIKMKIKV